MKVLLTGASSFTGYWIAKALADAGHEVVAPLLRDAGDYAENPRAERVRQLHRFARVEAGCAFGSDAFMRLLSEQFDLLAHHAAQVGDYRSADFDILGAVAANTFNLRGILASGKVGAMVLTSSVFAPGEGVGSVPLKAFSPYGLSKGITNQIVADAAERAGLPFGRFVIPNPFGPLEEPRFCAYLMKTWRAGQVARVNTPAYVRDNIHVGLLSRSYRRYAEQLVAGVAKDHINPSGYVGTQGDFTARVAREVKNRLGWDCAIELARQTDFSEPIMRVNNDPAINYVDNWSESVAWDEFAEAYR
ncbi:NAD(P)-dependent oxidoreductase [Nostoc sp. NIES-2111]